MRQELQEKLVEDFPLLYIKNHGCRIVFECQDGWYELIRELSEKLYPLVEIFLLEQDHDGYSTQASQVKEKYGSLRFYMDCETQEMSDLIREYEEKSTITCEVCGKPGETHNSNGWLTTTCKEHSK